MKIEIAEEGRRLIERYKNTRWFCSVGTDSPLMDSCIGITRVYSWKDCISTIRARGTDNFCIDIRNDIHNKLRNEYIRTINPNITKREIGKSIDGLIVDIKREAGLIADEVVMYMPAAYAHQEITGYFRWILLFTVLAKQYNAMDKSCGVVSQVAVLLTRGYCVCGWNGDYPKGTLVIY